MPPIPLTTLRACVEGTQRHVVRLPNYFFCLAFPVSAINPALDSDEVEIAPLLSDTTSMMEAGYSSLATTAQSAVSGPRRRIVGPPRRGQSMQEAVMYRHGLWRSGPDSCVS